MTAHYRPGDNPNDYEDDLMPEIEPEEIKFGERIGAGAFSQVYRGRCRGKDVAIKVFRKKKYREKDLIAFADEMKIMSKINHPNIILFMGACTKPGHDLMIITEILPMDLETLLIKNQKQVPLQVKIKLAQDSALGMAWLHGSNPIFIHRDLKLSNLLVDDSYRVKVCDFGLSQMKQRETDPLENSPQGSPLYMAPEAFMGVYDEKCDVYSFGLILWEMYTQKHVFPEFGDSLTALMNAVIDRDYRPAIPNDCPPLLSALMKKCWSPDPRRRPSFPEVARMLDEILLHVTINDELGCTLWKTHFLGKEEVGWLEFLEALSTLQGIDIDLDSHEVLSLKSILGEESKALLAREEVVTMKQFGMVLAWFGPLTKGPSFLQRVKSTVVEKWFHGDISAEQAEHLLLAQPKGTFMIRFSTSHLGAFVLSVVGKHKRVVHQRMKHVPGEGIHFAEALMPDLPSLMKDIEKKLKLSKACPGSKYQRLLFPGADEGPIGYTIPVIKRK